MNLSSQHLLLSQLLEAGYAISEVDWHVYGSADAGYYCIGSNGLIATCTIV